MTDVPDQLTLKRHRDLAGIAPYGIWVRRSVLGLIAVACIAALFNVFGQRPSTVRGEVPEAILSVY